jgi:hypothetical protein
LANTRLREPRRVDGANRVRPLARIYLLSQRRPHQRRPAKMSGVMKRRKAIEILTPTGTPLPEPDLSDMDRVHANVASGRLAEIFYRIGTGQSGTVTRLVPRKRRPGRTDGEGDPG